MRRSPGFFAAALLTLGLGTGANATVFSFVNALLLRPVSGVADPSMLVGVYTSDYSSGPFGNSSYPDYLDVKADADTLTSLAAYSEGAALLRVGDAVERVRRMAVTPEFFDTVGVRAAVGRTLSLGDFTATAPGVLLADSLWRRAFAADPATVGRTVDIDGITHVVVGIAPASFTSLSVNSVDVWVPLPDSVAPRGQRGDRGLMVVGRLRPDTRLWDAQAQVALIADRLAREFPETNRGTLQQPDAARPITVVVHTRMPPAFRSQVMALSGVLMGAVLLVLLIACANVANLMLARAASRRREVAIRLALGAGRRRVAQQMLTESLLLGAGGCVLGILFALWTADILPSFFPADQARLLDASVDMRVLAYTLVISLLAAVAFGMAPAAQAFRTASASTLRTSNAEAAARGGGHLRRSLIAAQIALATVLLVSAGLLVRSLVNSLTADLGFTASDALLASVELPADPTGQKTLAYYRSSLERVRALPGVSSASLTTTLPLARSARRGFRMDGYEPRQGEDHEFPFVVVERGYFETLGIALLDGRLFDARDVRDGAPVAVVNGLFADRFFGGRAVGRRVTDSSGLTMEVIGVVRTGKYLTVNESVPTVYYALEQAPRTTMTLIVRTSGAPLQSARSVRAAMLAEHPAAAVFALRSLASHLSEALAGERLTASLVAACAAIALLLALVGVYGVVAYAVGLRTREIGLRIALGAAPAAIVRLVLGEGIRVLGVGLVLGVAGAAAAATLLRSFLYGVTPLDAATFGSVIAALALATVAAAAIPARRALGVDPMIALRDD